MQIEGWQLSLGAFGAALLGSGLGWFIRSQLGKARLRSAEERAQMVVEEAQPEADRLKRDAQLEGREAANADSAAQQLDAVRRQADFVVENDADFASLHEQIKAVFRETLYFDRPSWDEYFMSIARVVASRPDA